MKILIGCESSGIVRDAFIRAGHKAVSCDLKPTERYGPHYQGSIFEILEEGWDMMICHPPCTYLCSSGLHWNGRVPGRAEKTEEAGKFAKRLWDAPIPLIALENPVGCLPRFIGKASQFIQPYEFGEDASKKTGLWLKGLPLLKGTSFFKGREVIWKGKKVMRWSNQTDSGQNNLPPSKRRNEDRSRTYQGIAQEMANQWSLIKDRPIQLELAL